ncbi:MAG: cyclic pyranopterin phosphate synthase [Cryomorphaceae bacterium]|jgi:cyclic pyranopterin phosphate synthase
MPVEVFGAGYSFLPREEILRFSEIERITQRFVRLGVRKIRLTGGEPLLRRDLTDLVSRLAKIDGVDDIAMTTNAALLAKHAADLKLAGLHRVTVSLDALDSEVFGKMNGVGASSDKVVAGIDAALAAGLGVKVNAVIKCGVNDHEVLALAEFARERAISMRYIEYMDTGNVNGWKLDEVVPSHELLETLKKEISLTKSSRAAGETAQRYEVEGEEGFEIGFISSVTQPFCSACNRARLSADGKIFTCLFASEGMDIKQFIREGASDEEIDDLLEKTWSNRNDNYSVQRSSLTENLPKAEMSYLGG